MVHRAVGVIGVGKGGNESARGGAGRTGEVERLS